MSEDMSLNKEVVHPEVRRVSNRKGERCKSDRLLGQRSVHISITVDVLKLGPEL